MFSFCILIRYEKAILFREHLQEQIRKYIYIYIYTHTRTYSYKEKQENAVSKISLVK